MRRVAALAGIVAIAVFALASSAAADPPRPTNFRSSVTSIEPSLPDGTTVRVIGGDAFLELRVARGTTAMVPDYGEDAVATARPYLRFDADGTVSRNDRSQAAGANESRFGVSTPDADEVAEGDDPVWTVVGTDGVHRWHDHRIHWMSPRAPRTDARGRVDLGGPDGGWEVGFVVDAEPVVVRGTLQVVDAPDPRPWWATSVVATLGGLVLAGVGVDGRRGPGHRWDVGSPQALVMVTTLVLCSAVVVAWTVWRAGPPGTGASPLPVLVSLVGVAAGVLAAVGPRRGRIVASALTAASAIGWSVLRLAVLDHALLPGSLPPGIDRSVTALALGLGIALAVVVAWRPTRFRSSRLA